MARWGTFKWGDGTKYGSSGLSTLLWAFEVDWDNDGVFDGSNDAPRLVDLTIQRGTRNLLKASGKGFEKPGVGNLIVALDNSDERYDPFNTSSPLYPNVWKDRYCRVRVKNGSEGTYYDVFSGKLDDIIPISGRNEVRITAKDGWQILNETKVTIALQENIRVDEAIALVLDAVGWPELWGSSLDASRATLDYWWADDEIAGDVIKDLIDREVGYFYISGSGEAVFLERYDDSSAVFSLTQADFLKEVAITQPWETRRNVAQVFAHGILENAQADLWTLQETTRIGVDESISMTVQYSYESKRLPAADVISPVVDVDYQVNSQIDGAGVDLSDHFSVTASIYAKTATITVQNNSGQVGYMTLLKIRGKALDQPDALTYEKDNSAGGEKRVFIMDNRWIYTINTARGYAHFMVGYLNANNAYLTVYQKDQAAHQFGTDLTNLLNAAIDKKSIDGLYRMNYLEHRWQKQTGQLVKTTWYLIPARDNSTYWRLGTSKLGLETKVAFGG